jgi:Ca2+/Na+ antiporter
MVPLPIAGVFGSFAYNVTMTIVLAALVRPLILHHATRLYVPLLLGLRGAALATESAEAAETL